MRAYTYPNVEYHPSERAAVRTGTRPQLPHPAIPCLAALRVYFPDDRRHIARLVRRAPGLIAALRENGFTIPAIDQDQDRR